jgi:hypothetical protein
MGGAAEGLLNLAILSFIEPETARGAGAEPGELERELDAGGVRLVGGVSDLSLAE